VNQASIRIIDSARRSKLKTRIVSFEPVGSHGGEDASVKVVRTLFHDKLPRPLKRVAYGFRIQDIMSSCALPLLSECDLIHILPPLPTIFYSSMLGLSYKFKLKRDSPKLIIHVYHPFLPVMKDFSWGRGFFARTFWREKLWLLKNGTFDHIFCVNKYLKRFMTQFVSDKIVHYVPYPVDTDLFKPSKDRNVAREKLGLPLDKTIIGYIGQIYHKRGIFKLLDAFNRVKNELPDASLVIATRGLNPELPQVHLFLDYLKKLEARNRVIVLSQPLERVELFYQSVDIMVLPFTQPYYVIDPPLAVTETLASGVPLITTPLGAINEVTSNGTSAVHVRPGNVRGLSEEIITLASDPELCSRLGEEARKSAMKRSFGAVGSLLAEKYKNILISA